MHKLLVVTVEHRCYMFEFNTAEAAQKAMALFSRTGAITQIVQDVHSDVNFVECSTGNDVNSLKGWD